MWQGRTVPTRLCCPQGAVGLVLALPCPSATSLPLWPCELSTPHPGFLRLNLWHMEVQPSQERMQAPDCEPCIIFMKLGPAMGCKVHPDLRDDASALAACLMAPSLCFLLGRSA